MLCVHYGCFPLAPFHYKGIWILQEKIALYHRKSNEKGDKEGIDTWQIYKKGIVILFHISYNMFCRCRGVAQVDESACLGCKRSLVRVQSLRPLKIKGFVDYIAL